MSGIALTTAGVKVWYAVETEAGKRPEAGYKHIEDIKETPDLNPEPEAHETTDLEQTECKTYTPGLKDLGGALGFLANFTQKLQTEWASIVEASETAIAAEKKVWFQITHPKLSEAVFLPGIPSPMGMPQMSVNGVLETTVYITPTGAPVWEPKVEA